MSDRSVESVAAWSRYWHSAQLAACLGGEDGNYAGVIRAAWEEFFSQAPAGAVVVDLATGNGAVALIAADTSLRSGRCLEIHGVDRAELAPEVAAEGQTERLDIIQFHPGTSIEALPFADDSVGMVSSQYGIEYADIDAVLVECARILTRGGRLMMITHSTDSRVMRQTEIDLYDSELLTTELQIVSKYKTLLIKQMGIPRPAPREEQERAMHEFQNSSVRVVQEISNRDEKQANFLNEVMHRFGEIYQQRHDADLATALALADEISLELEAHRRRLLDLKQAALAPADIARVIQLARGLDFECVGNEAVINDSGGKLGHRLEFVMNGAKPEAV